MQIVKNVSLPRTGPKSKAGSFRRILTVSSS